MTYEHPEAPDPERLSAAAAEAQARLIEETEEWEIADEECGDGGSAVKLLPAAEMAQARAFQQGLNRAVKAEEKFNRNYGRSGPKYTWRDRHSGNGTNRYDENYPSLKPSVERKGEITFHAANEKKMREKTAQYHDDDDDDDDWGIIRETDGKAAGQNDGADEQSRNRTNQHGNNNTTIISQGNNRDPDYIPPHKRALQNRALKEPQNKPKPQDDDDDGGEGLIMLHDDKPKETPPPPPPLPPQHLMARLKLLDADADDRDDGGVPLS